MGKLLLDLSDHGGTTYFDDILIVNLSNQEYLAAVRIVLDSSWTS